MILNILSMKLDDPKLASAIELSRKYGFEISDTVVNFGGPNIAAVHIRTSNLIGKTIFADDKGEAYLLGEIACAINHSGIVAIESGKYLTYAMDIESILYNGRKVVRMFGVEHVIVEARAVAESVRFGVKAPLTQQTFDLEAYLIGLILTSLYEANFTIAED